MILCLQITRVRGVRERLTEVVDAIQHYQDGILAFNTGTAAVASRWQLYIR